MTSAAPVAAAGRDATLADMLSLSAPRYLLNSPVHASLLARISALKMGSVSNRNYVTGPYFHDAGCRKFRAAPQIPVFDFAAGTAL